MMALLALSTQPDTAALGRMILEQNEDCELETAADGFSALIALIQTSYDLVILDTALPVIPGLNLLRYLRMVGRERPVILAGYQPTFAQARQGILGKAEDFLPLPISAADSYDLTLPQDIPPDRVDGNRTLEMALHIFDVVAERLRESGESKAGQCAKLGVLYHTYLTYAFNYFPWLRNYLKLESWCFDTAPRQSEIYRVRLGELTDTIRRLYPKTDNPLLQEVLQYLLTHIDQPLRQKDVAAQFFISPSSLSLLFTEHSDLVYNNYIFSLKLARAAYLLRYTDRKIQDISALLGYQDSGYFSRQFKKAFLLTPSAYRSTKR